MENILTIGNEYPYGYEKFPAKIFEIGHMSCHKYFDSLAQCLLKILRIFEFCCWHLLRDRLMFPNSISEEKLKIDWKMEDLQAGL